MTSLLAGVPPGSCWRPAAPWRLPCIRRMATSSKGECYAFPSGHAASAFAAASVLERHFGYRASWPALAAATYVGTSRLVDDRHFLSDVVFGAAPANRLAGPLLGAMVDRRTRCSAFPSAGG